MKIFHYLIKHKMGEKTCGARELYLRATNCSIQNREKIEGKRLGCETSSALLI
jgi:hypothetical protein